MVVHGVPSSHNTKQTKNIGYHEKRLFAVRFISIKGMRSSCLSVARNRQTAMLFLRVGI